MAECLAYSGDRAALRYIEELATIAPHEADAVRSELFFRQGELEEAALYLQKFLQAAHDDPWPEQNLLRRALIRAEMIARAEPGAESTHHFYELLSIPLAIWNCESERRARLLSIGTLRDGAQLGRYTAPALSPFEPYVKWERKFLEIRKACYQGTHNPRFAKASDDLDEFLANEPITADASLLAKLLRQKNDNVVSELAAPDLAHLTQR
jgi:hypothetical protein